MGEVSFPPLKHLLLPPSFSSSLVSLLPISVLFAMKIFVKLSPKHLFGSKKSRSDPSSFSSSSEDASLHHNKPATPTSVLPGDWSHVNFGPVVSVKELEELLARFGAEPPSREEVAEMLREIGCDGNGCVSVEALMSRVGSVCGPTCDSDLRETFDFFDTDRDGRITAPELLEVFKAMGDGRCTLEDCRRMIAVVDENKDGFVCFEDFSRMMDLQS